MGKLKAAFGEFWNAWRSYDAASNDPNTSFGRPFLLADTRDEDNLSKLDRRTIIDRCRQLYRDSALISAGVDRLRTYSIGPQGIFPIWQTSDERVNQAYEDYWFNIVNPYIDVTQRSTLVDIQRQIITALYLDGAILIVFLDNGSIQLIEEPRIGTPDELKDNPKIVDGIKIDKLGRIQGFFVLPRDVNGYIKSDGDYDYVKAEDSIYVANTFRPDQIHGIPKLAPVVMRVRALDELGRATLDKAKAEARQVLKLTRNSQGFAQEGRKALSNKAASNTDPIAPQVKSPNLTVWDLRNGEDVSAISGVTPNGTYTGFVEQELKIISAAINLPVEYLLFSFDSSFSASRASMITAEVEFAKLHDLIAEKVMRRIVYWRMAWSMKRNLIPQAPVVNGVSEYKNVEFTKPYIEFIDPNTRTNSDKARYSMGVSSIKEIAASMGKDRNAIFKEKQSDIMTAIKIAQEIEDQTGITISWQDIIDVRVAGVGNISPTTNIPSISTLPENKSTDTQNTGA